MDSKAFTMEGRSFLRKSHKKFDERNPGTPPRTHAVRGHVNLLLTFILSLFFPFKKLGYNLHAVKFTLLIVYFCEL